MELLARDIPMACLRLAVSSFLYYLGGLIRKYCHSNRSVVVEFSVWTMLYYAVFSLYYFVLGDSAKRDFLVLAKHIDKRLDYFVLSFILGFFV